MMINAIWEAPVLYMRVNLGSSPTLGFMAHTAVAFPEGLVFPVFRGAHSPRSRDF